MYSQSNIHNLLFFIPYFMSWYQSCRFLRPGHHSGLHRHFSRLHSWIFFYSCVILLAFIAIGFSLSRSALIPKRSDFFGRCQRLQRRLLQHNRRRLFDLNNSGNCKTFRLRIGWMEKITLNDLNLFALCWKGKGRSTILWVQDQNQEIPVLKHGMKKILWLWRGYGILRLLRLATHVCSWLRLRIFGTQSNRRIQKLEMRLKYMRLRWRRLLQNREVK